MEKLGLVHFREAAAVIDDAPGQDRGRGGFSVDNRLPLTSPNMNMQPENIDLKEESEDEDEGGGAGKSNTAEQTVTTTPPFP